MDVDALLPGLTYLLFKRINPTKNETQFYYIAWEPILLEVGVVARIYGRKGGAGGSCPLLPFPPCKKPGPLFGPSSGAGDCPLSGVSSRGR
jgi:hypothetical protein